LWKTKEGLLHAFGYQDKVGKSPEQASPADSEDFSATGGTKNEEMPGSAANQPVASVAAIGNLATAAICLNC
jgi:hypothetical protein